MSDVGRIVERFFALQRAMYTGGPLGPVLLDLE